MTRAEDTSRRRKAGRRPKDATDPALAGLSRDAILDHIVALAQTEQFGDISIARIGRDLGVAASLIHYHFGTKEELRGLLMNLALREVVTSAPAPTGEWRTDFEGLLRAFYLVQLRWKGITAETSITNRYSLFQSQLLDGEDYGFLYFDMAGKVLRTAGLSPEQAAQAYHVAMLFTLSAARAELFRQDPNAKGEAMLNHAAQFSDAHYPGSAFLLPPFVHIGARESFEAGLKLILDGVANELRDST